MTNVNLQVSSQKYISLGVLLGLLVIIIPVFMFNIGADGSNPYVDELSPFIVLSMSCFVLFVLWVNRNRRIAVLEVFIFVYIIFWHFRFLTLALFPDGELVLTRTVLIDSEIFNDYIWLVFISLVATVIGICIGFGLSNIKSERYKEKKRRCSHKLTILVYRKKYNILLYCLFAFGYELYFMQILPGFLPSWKGYLGFLFSFEFFLFLVALTLLNELVSTKFKVIMFTLMLLYVLMTVISGSRSVLMHFVIVVLFLLLVFDKPIKFRLRHFFL